MTNPPDKHKALAKMQALCARAEHCTFEIALKLSRAGLSRADADDIIAALRRDRFIDDRRYAMAFVSDKVRFARWGTRKIALALRAKHIDSALIAEALAGIAPGQFLSAAVAAARSRFRTPQQPPDFDTRARIYRFLAGRGFDSDTIRRAIGLLSSPDPDTPAY